MSLKYAAVFFFFSLSLGQSAEGLLDFLPGERLKYINMTIIDNSVPELDKVFRVELYNPQGGGKRHKPSFHCTSSITNIMGLNCW